MTGIFSTLALPRDWRMTALAGVIVLPVSYALYHYVVPLGAWIGVTPTPLLCAAFAVITAILAMTAALALLGRRMQLHNKRMRVALDNMSQGLCMFDRNEKLVVCNQRYRTMYNLPHEVAHPGTIARRTARIPHRPQQFHARPGSLSA